MNITFHTLTAENKEALNLSYLGDVHSAHRHSVLELGWTTHIMVFHLYRATVSKTQHLTESQLADLVADIQYCKSNGLWNNQEEKDTIDWCKQIIEEREMYSKMSDRDKKAYDEIREKAIDKFLEKAEREMCSIC